MAEYIDKQGLIKFLDNIQQPKMPITEGFKYITIDDAIRVVSERSTIQVIPLDRIKQAREEISDLDIHFDNDYFSSNRDAMFKCNEVLEILDKLIAESEE